MLISLFIPLDVTIGTLMNNILEQQSQALLNIDITMRQAFGKWGLRRRGWLSRHLQRR